MSLKGMITDGTVVKFRDGRLAVALKDISPKDNYNTYKFYGLKDLTGIVNKGGIICLDSYDDHLDDKKIGDQLSKYDIMAITTDHFCFKDLIRIMFGFVSANDILWSWEREVIREVTMAEVEEKFGCKVKIVNEV